MDGSHTPNVYTYNIHLKSQKKKKAYYVVACMKNVTGVRRNGVLYGRRLHPRINHFPLFLQLSPTTLPSPNTAR